MDLFKKHFVILLTHDEVRDSWIADIHLPSAIQESNPNTPTYTTVEVNKYLGKLITTNNSISLDLTTTSNDENISTP